MAYARLLIFNRPSCGTSPAEGLLKVERREFRCFRVEGLGFRGSGVQGFRGSGVQGFRGSGVQVFRCLGV